MYEAARIAMPAIPSSLMILMVSMLFSALVISAIS